MATSCCDIAYTDWRGGEAGGLGTYWMNEWVGGWANATLDSQGLLSVAGSFLQLASQDVGTLACPR